MNSGISPTLLMNETILSKKKNGEEVFALGFGMSPFPVPEVLSNSLSEKSVMGMYLPSAGLPELKERIAQHHAHYGAQNIESDQVVISPGSKEMIFQIQWACKLPLLLPSPSWVSYGPQARLLDLDLHWIPTDKNNQYKLTASALENYISEQKLAESLLILNYPNNPTGVTYSNEELKSIAEVCRANQVTVISDEIYGLLNYKGDYHTISSFLPEQTIVTSGLSKWCNAGGYRLGYGVFPKSMADIKKMVITQASETYSCVAAPIQYAAVDLFDQWEVMMATIKKQRKVLEFVSSYMIAHLEALEIHCSKSDGGFYTFIDFDKHGDYIRKKEIETSDELCHYLLDQHSIALLPGTAFGRPSSEFSARLAFVDFSGKEALSAINNFNDSTEFIEKTCPKIYHAIHQFKHFLTI